MHYGPAARLPRSHTPAPLEHQHTPHTPALQRYPRRSVPPDLEDGYAFAFPTAPDTPYPSENPHCCEVPQDVRRRETELRGGCRAVVRW